MRRCVKQRRLQHDAHEHDEAHADAPDHGAAGVVLEDLDEVERIEVDDRPQLGVTADRPARTDPLHHGADHQPAEQLGLDCPRVMATSPRFIATDVPVSSITEKRNRPLLRWPATMPFGPNVPLS